MSDWLIMKAGKGIVNVVTGISIERDYKNRVWVVFRPGPACDTIVAAEAIAYIEEQGFTVIGSKVSRRSKASEPKPGQITCYDSTGKGYTEAQWRDCLKTWQIGDFSIDVRVTPRDGIRVSLFTMSDGRRAEEEGEELYQTFCQATLTWYETYCKNQVKA